jgi:hypothetical protein
MSHASLIRLNRKIQPEIFIGSTMHMAAVTPDDQTSSVEPKKTMRQLVRTLNRFPWAAR